MKNSKLIFLTSTCLLALSGCNFLSVSTISNSENTSNTTSQTTSEQPNSSNTTTSQSTSSETPGEETVIKNSQEYLNFWNPSTKLALDIQMSAQAAEFINQYQSNHDDSTYHDYYVPCKVVLTINGKSTTYDEVGIRQKGNLSRTNMLDNGNFSLNSLAHYKLSFKETFDGDEYSDIDALAPFKKIWTDSAAKKERKNRTLFDMEKIDIKWNRNDDETKSKQAYTLKMFRDNGVMAGHDTLAETSLSVTGKGPVKTTYEILECIDSVFVKRHFGESDADGDLYKCAYTGMGPANFTKYTIGKEVGVEDNTKNYHPIYDLKTNKKKNTTHQSLLDFIAVVNDKTSSASAFKEKLEKAFDIKSFMMYESIAYLAGNFDDFRNNANNYYLYITNTTKKTYFIPYDFDRCFGAGCEGRKDYMTNFSPESTKMQCSGNWQTINLYWRTVCTSSSQNSIERVEEYRAMYQKNIEDLLNNSTISNDSFTSYVNSFPSEYRGNPNGAGDENTTFSNYLSKKIAAIKSNCPDYNIK